MMKKKLGCGRSHHAVPTATPTKGSQVIISTGAKIETPIAFATVYSYALNATWEQTDKILTRSGTN